MGKETIAIVGIIAIALVIVFLVAVDQGFIEIPEFNIPGINGDNGDNGDDLDPEDEEAPPGATYCGFTQMQILDMIETITGKTLNEAAGLTFIGALNMEACGSDDEPASSISTFYKSLYSSWFIYEDIADSGVGWVAYRIAWINAEHARDATLAKAVLIVDGITVEATYGY
ncbi:unnamed protein product, partial [marine sediment metagenome]